MTVAWSYTHCATRVLSLLLKIQVNCPLNLSCQQWRNCFTSIAPFKNEHVKFGFGIISELNLYVSGDFIREIYPKEV